MSNQMEEYIKAIQYKITDGSEFLWQCFGANARFLDSSDEDFHVSAIFDTETKMIYEAAISSTYGGDIRYRWINLDFIEAYKEEAKNRGVDWMEFCDGTPWAMTDTYEDIIDKITKILKGEEYDPRVVLCVDLDEDVKETIEHAAMLQGVTVDEFFEMALRAVIDKGE